MRKQIYFIDFNEKPLVAKKGYIKDVMLEKLNKEDFINVEHNGNKFKIKINDIFINKNKADERINDYYIIKKFKANHKHICAYCGKIIINPENLTVDHIIPRSKGGKTIEKNLCIACKKCNEDKTNEKPFIHINKEIKVQINKEKKYRNKIARSINLKADNAEYLAKKDSRVWNLKLFNSKNPYKLANQLGY